MIGPLIDKQVKVTKEQEDVLGRLNVLFIHEFPTAFGEGMIEIQELYNKKNWQEGSESDDFKAGWKLGYLKAIWDATIIISQAEDGYLPSDKTMEKWLEDRTNEMKEQGFKFKKIQTKDFGEMTEVTFDEDESVQTDER